MDLIVTRQTDLGWEVIINDIHKGLVFTNEVFQKMAVGGRTKGYVKRIRPDSKIDISLQPIGREILEPTAKKIYEVLCSHDGFLPLHD